MKKENSHSGCTEKFVKNFGRLFDSSRLICFEYNEFKIKRLSVEILLDHIVLWQFDSHDTLVIWMRNCRLRINAPEVKGTKLTPILFLYSNNNSSIIRVWNTCVNTTTFFGNRSFKKNVSSLRHLNGDTFSKITPLFQHFGSLQQKQGLTRVFTIMCFAFWKIQEQDTYDDIWN